MQAIIPLESSVSPSSREVFGLDGVWEHFWFYNFWLKHIKKGKKIICATC